MANVSLGNFVRFVHVGKSKSGKTSIWEVRPLRDDLLLGRIQWHGPWRCYCFLPEVCTVFEQVCLQDIALFCGRETKQHRVKLQFYKAMKEAEHHV